MTKKIKINNDVYTVHESAGSEYILSGSSTILLADFKSLGISYKVWNDVEELREAIRVLVDYSFTEGYNEHLYMPAEDYAQTERSVAQAQARVDTLLDKMEESYK